MDFKTYYANQQKLVENYLQNRIAKKGISKVDEAMEYSLMAGGKRIRPILLMATAEALGSKGYNYLPVACGLEMIHTYSLIHDDLPCMDNDDYRRGRLTNHKVFGEAMAVLAGDGLLTLAFEVMLEQKNVEPKALIETVREMAMCAGNFGMVGGQGLDLEYEGKQITPEALRKLHSGKTGALFIAAIRGGDEKNHKSTYVSLYGLQAAHELAEKTVNEALECLTMFGENAEPLREITRMMTNRKK